MDTAMDTVKLTQSESQTLISRGYELLSKIGEGSYTKVYLSTHKEFAQKLACKVVDINTSSSLYVHKFLPRELKILMEIKHTNIIHIHSIFRKHLKYYIFMRLAEKGDLMDYIMRNGVVGENQSIFWTKQIGSALQYLHQHHIAHRDLKCENILITENNNVKLTDFGFSRYILVTNDPKSKFSETYCGSLLYVSPEVVKGVAYDPFKSDLWSVGVVIFTMLNRKVPFNETHPSVIYELQMNKKFKFRDDIPIPKQGKNLVKWLLQPLPQERPTLDEVLQHDWFIMELEGQKVKENTSKVAKQIDHSSIEKGGSFTSDTKDKSVDKSLDKSLDKCVADTNVGYPVISKSIKETCACKKEFEAFQFRQTLDDREMKLKAVLKENKSNILVFD